MRAIVVFCDGNHKLSWLLKPGFRHCFVCLDSSGLWIQLDACKGIPMVRYLTTSDFDLTEHWRSQGLTVVETYQRNKAVTWPLIARNCVGFVKTILSISACAITPYGLYKYLRKNRCN